MQITELNPREIWQNFYLLTQVPRPSGHLTQVQDFLLKWAAVHQRHAPTHSTAVGVRQMARLDSRKDDGGEEDRKPGRLYDLQLGGGDRPQTGRE